MSKVIVVGGGAAGMLAAIAASEQGNNVTLIEKNEKLGKKIFITGKGRCNITNMCDMNDFFDSVVHHPKFLYSACFTFTNQHMIGLLEAEGCPVKIERGERAFPVSDHSSDVIKALTNRLKKNNVTILLNTKVQDLIIKESESGKLVAGVLLSKQEEIQGDSVIIATGGISYPMTGSDGDGHKIAKKLGHNITELKPALVPFTIKEQWCKELQGLSLKNVSISVNTAKKQVYEGLGEMLFTHFGVSGPLILTASSYLSKKEIETKTTLRIDLKPGLSHEQLDKRVLRDFSEQINKQFKNVLHGLFPQKLIPVIITLSKINPEKKVNEITKEERSYFVKLIKALTLTIEGTRNFNEAIITQGGINVKEVNPSTMESKLINNLFFAGEILDVDALTGGFNLQIAWSTGYLAGESVS